MFGLMASSCGTSKGVEVEVIKDCTGVYVRSNNEDFFVCNKSVLAENEPGSKVIVKMEEDQAENCEGKDDIVCMMYHEHKGVVRIKLVD